MRGTPRQKALAAIEAVGGEWLESDGGAALSGMAWSPAGSMWRATGCHVVSIHFFTDRPAAWKALLEDVALGVEPCTQTDCDTCEEEA